ncbi:hypothetical protein ACIBG4_40855 [Nonomuraea sp. NPDC050383]|uniref:hypothetical protein n=1 Tax=Nonomuraea sp. NPDC050383 TaxID=3364362 RepID=UPI0037B30408
MMTPNCPRCASPLDEGPIVYRCAHCRRTVYAADLNNEYVPRTPATAGASR